MQKKSNKNTPQIGKMHLGSQEIPKKYVFEKNARKKSFMGPNLKAFFSSSFFDGAPGAPWAPMGPIGAPMGPMGPNGPQWAPWAPMGPIRAQWAPWGPQY